MAAEPHSSKLFKTLNRETSFLPPSLLPLPSLSLVLLVRAGGVWYTCISITPLSPGLQLSAYHGSVVLGTPRCAGMVVQDVHGYRDVQRRVEMLPALQ